MLGLELAISIEKSLNLAMREAILVYIILQVKGLPVISFFFSTIFGVLFTYFMVNMMTDVKIKYQNKERYYEMI
jgi:hypothetical protein